MKLNILAELFNPEGEEVKRIISHNPICCGIEAEYIIEIKGNYLYQCPTCKKLHRVFKYE